MTQKASFYLSWGHTHPQGGSFHQKSTGYLVVSQLHCIHPHLKSPQGQPQIGKLLFDHY